MENVLEIAKLLGEENVKKLKDSITNALIERCIDELNDMNIWVIDYEQLFDEIQDEVKAVMKDKIMKKYIEMAEGKFSELFEKNIEH